jgi:hypothetical protein
MADDDSGDSKIKALRERMQREHDEIVSGVGLVTRVWATLETSLFSAVLPACKDGNAIPWGPEIAGVIFYTPSNTETRVSLVDNLISYHCEMHSIGDVDKRLVALWNTKIKGKINNLKNTRNAIVHGTIVSSSKGGFDQHVRLSPAFGDTLRSLTYIRQRKHPGLGPNELRVHERAVWRVNERTQKLTRAFALRMQLQFGPESTKAIQDLLALLPQLESEMDSDNGAPA